MKAQDGGFIGQPGDTSVQFRKLAVKRYVMRGLFRRLVRQTEPLLHAVNAQHGRHRNGWISCLPTIACGSTNQTNSAHGTIKVISPKNLRLRVLWVTSSNLLATELLSFKDIKRPVRLLG